EEPHALRSGSEHAPRDDLAVPDLARRLEAVPQVEPLGPAVPRHPADADGRVPGGPHVVQPDPEGRAADAAPLVAAVHEEPPQVGLRGVHVDGVRSSCQSTWSQSGWVAKPATTGCPSSRRSAARQAISVPVIPGSTTSAPPDPRTTTVLLARSSLWWTSTP